MTDIAQLGLEIRSDGVVVAKDRLRALNEEAGRSEARAQTLKRLWVASLAGVTAGMAAFGIGIVGAVRRMEDMRRMSLQVDQALKNSGNSARTSAREIEAWADRLEDRTGRAAKDVMAVSANLASFGFGRAEFFRSLELANDMAAAWGGDLKQNLEGLARALDDPLNGMAMLSKRGIKLTEEQKDMAAAFLDAGDKVAAQGVVFEALEAQVKGVAEAGFGGLTAAIARGRKAWEDAFEDLVKGEGQTGDLRDTLVELAETVSSPEFIRSVMGFGKILVQGMTAVAQAVVWAWGKMQAFLQWLDQQNPNKMSAGDLDGRITKMKQDLATAEGKLAASGPALFGTIGVDAGGLFGTKFGAEENIKYLKKDLQSLLEEQAKRSNPAAFDVGATFDSLKGGNAFDSPDAMWRFLSPGTMFGQGEFNPYEGMDFTTDKTAKAAAKAKKAYDELTLSARQFIDEQAVEAQTLGMTQEAASRLRHEQELLAKAANDNINLTPAQTEELKNLAAQMAAAEEATRRLVEIYDFGKETVRGFFSDLKGGIEEGKGLWASLGDAAANALQRIADKALEMAADGIWDMLFGALKGAVLGGGMGGGWNIPTSFVPGGFYPGLATGGTVAGDGMTWVGERGPELLKLPRGAQVFNHQQSTQMAANGNGVTVNAPITINGNADAMTLRQMDVWARNTLPGLVKKAVNDPYAVGS